MMDCSNIGDSPTRRSNQPAMSGNTRELASSLVEMIISSKGLSMKEAAAFQGGDAQQPPGDCADALNEDPVNVDLKDVKGFQEDPMIVDENPTGPNEDAAANANYAGE